MHQIAKMQMLQTYLVSRHERYQLTVIFSLSLPANDPVKSYLLTEYIFFSEICQEIFPGNTDK